MKYLSYYSPLPDLHRVLNSPQVGEALMEAARDVEKNYQSIVAKRTGTLADSATINLTKGGINNDRLTARISVTAPYAATHEFGAGDHPGSSGRHTEPASRELLTALQMTSKGRRG